ncbi:hypothetical protein [Paractinoplanes rishiriensis]|uniref:Uncharacterized protein n=1 Tax=Paractinoplanes rishiriensis TaxID=1050105 RepID=A0A919K440_9ACTN|nr:hypothetical protein [Actinoplanes rishiriensis]GIE98942.1 hypothetical protein Ari01nite_64070 [Actinoplanes rishiriensis]
MNDDQQTPQRRSAWAAIWAAWLAIAAVAFAVLETIALARRQRGDTLSENIRVWLGTDKRSKTWGALGFVVALVGFVVWFIPHIVFNIW